MNLRYLVLAAFAALSFLSAPAQAQQQNTTVSFTPVIQNAQYVSGNAMGGLQTLPFLRPARAGIINSATVFSQGGGTTAMTFYVFDTAPSAATTCTDKAAFVLAAADVSKLAFAPFVLTPAVVGAGTTASTAQLAMIIPVRNNDSGTPPNLYLCIVSDGTWTPASVSDLVGKITASFVK